MTKLSSGIFGFRFDLPQKIGGESRPSAGVISAETYVISDEFWVALRPVFSLKHIYEFLVIREVVSRCRPPVVIYIPEVFIPVSYTHLRNLILHFLDSFH